MKVLTSIDLPGVARLSTGKVREIFDLGDRLLMVASDRVSAFDVVMREGVPRKGEVLTQISKFWFDKTADWLPNHLITCDVPEGLPEDLLRGRTMVVRKAKPLPIECVVRGYLSGSGWKEYRELGTLAGERLPKGLLESGELPEPMFTPATKEATGHDINITCEDAAQIVGEDVFRRARDLSLRLYGVARDYARGRGIIVADTKFEFGVMADGSLIIIDEVLTPDSSRFWPADGYRPGGSQPSFDKQPLRDYLEGLDWDKRPPPPTLPAEVVGAMTARYVEAYRRITGRELGA
ncbi:MAG TPA: phosphoribosylaminoimidazolesuccinocarboxamide synthase [Verrucomicrobiae bacterium]|nr:phosphoribosylaminoimidazolesuccinocarboxamide synthase [Verrucomicrobiae bacterium]